MTSTERISSPPSRGRAGLHGEIENFARLQFDRRGEIAGADLRALDVHHDGDLAADAAALTARMRRITVARPVVFRVRHVQADDVGAGADHFLQHLLAFGRGPEREDDLGAAKRILDGHHERGV